MYTQPFTMDMLRNGAFCSIISAAFVLSCGSPQQDQQGSIPSSSTPVDSPTVEQKGLVGFYLQAFDTEYPQGRAIEARCGRYDFAHYIHEGNPTTHQAIGVGNVQVEVKSLQDAVAALTCSNTGDIKHGIIVHHGLDMNDDYTAFLQIVCLTYDAANKNYSYAGSASGYTLDGHGKLIPDVDGLTKWMDAGGAGDDYASKVVIDEDGTGTFVRYVYDTDVRAQIFPYEGCIAHLIAHNQMGPEEFLLLEPFCEPATREENPDGTYRETGFEQCVIWTPVGRTLTDVFDTNAPYLDKVADLGSPCPVTCPNYPFQFRKRGLAPRKNC